MDGRLEGKVALITGAARGQGREHAIRVAEEGADVIAVDLCAPIASVPYPMPERADLDETARLVEKLGRRVFSVTADVRDRDQLDTAVTEGVQQLGRLDLVSANAGISTPVGLLDIDSQQWKDTIDVNLTGAFNTIRAAAPHLIAGGRGGSIVLTSSSVAIKPVPNLADYISSKHGMVGLTRAAALELGAHNIRVNSVHPSTVKTPMIQNTAYRVLFRPDLDDPTDSDVAEVTRNFHVLPIPWVESRDISNALVFLFSDEARYITGVQLPIDGGGLLR